MKNDSPWHNKTLLTLCAGQLVMAIGFGFVSPILPKFVGELGVSPARIGTLVGLAITAYGIARVSMDLPAGKLAQRWGRRPALILGPALMSIGALGCGLATEYWQLIAFRLLQGVGSSIYNVTCTIVVCEISTLSNRGQYLSLDWGSFLIGSSLGPTLGGFVGGYLGYRAPFFCFSFLALLATLWFYFRIPETRKTQHAGMSQTSNTTPQPNSSKKMAFSYKNLNFVLICTVALLTMFTMSGRIVLVPLLGYERLGLSEIQVGLVLTSVAIMQCAFVFPAGRLSDKSGRKIIIVSGGAISAAAFVLFTQSYSYHLCLLSGAILGIGRGFGGPVISAYVADIAPAEDYEHTIALYRTITDVGFLIGPTLLGWLKDIHGLDFPFFVAAGLLLGAITFFAILADETVSRRKNHNSKQTENHSIYST